MYLYLQFVPYIYYCHYIHRFLLFFILLRIQALKNR